MTNPDLPLPPPGADHRLQALEAQIQALQASEAQARALFLNAPVAALLLTPDGLIHDLNTLAYGLLALPTEPPRRLRFRSLLAAGSRAEFDAFVRQVQAVPRPQSLEVRVAPEGTPALDVRLDMVVQRSPGQPDLLQVVLTDLTAYKQAHQTLLNEHEVLHQAQQGSSAAIRALHEELHAVVKAVIQELYLPASRIMSATGLLRQGLGEQAEPLEALEKPALHIERGGQQLIAILQSVERYLNARRIRPRIRRVPLNAVLKEVLRKVEPLLADRTVTVTHDALPTLQGDSQALKLILEEYLANALKFTRPRDEARIHLRVKESGTECLIGVEDNGMGFNMRDKDRLFRLFQRQHASSQFEGAGLGLATVRQTAERFGARVWAEGKPDQGATFWLAWPKQPHLRD
jgi:signal transduction histidine kinase